MATTNILPPGAGGQTPEPESSRLAELSEALLLEVERRGLDHDDGDDIVQEINLLVLEKEELRKKVEGFSSRQLARFAGTRVRDHLRDRARKALRWEKVFWDDGDDKDESVPAPSPNPEACFLGDELKERIDREVARWTAKQRDPWLLDQEGWPRADIAAHLDIGVSTVDGHLANAKEALFVLLEPDFPQISQLWPNKTHGRAKP